MSAVANSENDMILIRFFNDKLEKLNYSFIYSPSLNMIQWLTSDPTITTKINVFDSDIKVRRRLLKDGDYYYIRGGFEDVAVYGESDDLFATLTDYVSSYELAKYSNGNRSFEFIKYLPPQYMNSSLFTLSIFMFHSDDETVTVTNDRKLYIQGNENMLLYY